MRSKIGITSLLVVILMTLLVGCAGESDTSLTDSGEVNSSSVSINADRNESSYKETIKDAESKENYYYQLPSSLPATSNDSLDKPERKFKDPYKMIGITIETVENTDEIEDQTQSEIGKEENVEVDIAEESNVIDTEDTKEPIDDTQELEEVLSEDEIKALDKKRLAFNINNKIVYDIYQNGILLLDNVQSEEEFNSRHKTPLRVIFENTQSELEEIEQLGIDISDNFSNNSAIIDSWKKLYSELYNYRNTLNVMQDCKEVVKSAKELKSETIYDSVKEFMKAIEIEISDYKPSGLEAINISEVGETNVE